MIHPEQEGSKNIFKKRFLSYLTLKIKTLLFHKGFAIKVTACSNGWPKKKKKFQRNFLHRLRCDQLPLPGIISFFLQQPEMYDFHLKRSGKNTKLKFCLFHDSQLNYLFFNEKFSLMWSNSKIFIDFITFLLLFYVLGFLVFGVFFWPQLMWNLNSTSIKRDAVFHLHSCGVRVVLLTATHVCRFSPGSAKPACTHPALEGDVLSLIH